MGAKKKRLRKSIMGWGKKKNRAASGSASPRLNALSPYFLAGGKKKEEEEEKRYIAPSARKKEERGLVPLQ